MVHWHGTKEAIGNGTEREREQREREREREIERESALLGNNVHDG